VPKGSRVGALLGAVEAWWIQGGFTADRAACPQKLATQAVRDGG